MSDRLPLGILKVSPDYFVVQELVGNPAEPVALCGRSSIRGWDGQSPITVFNLTKRGCSTESAIREVARQLGVALADVSYHGLKDKQAQTSQLIGVRGKFRSSFSHSQIFLNQLGGHDRPLGHGQNKGNRFKIRVISAAQSINFDAVKTVPNFFGGQRVGRPGTENVGRLLFEGDYDQAAELILKLPSQAILRQLIKQTASVDAALLHPEFKFDFDFELNKWRSWLWNQLLQERLGKACPARLPLWDPGAEVDCLYRHLWNPGALNLEALSRIHCFSRATVIEPRNFRAERNLIGWKLELDLSPGVYATVVLSHLFDLEEEHLSRYQ